MGISKLYPFECIKIENDGKKVMELFKVMKSDGEKNGYTPIIIIEDENGLMEENIKFAEKDFGSFQGFTEDCLANYKKVDVEKYFKEREKSYKEDGLIDIQEEADEGCIACNSIYAGEKNENVFIAKVPTTKPYEVFAYIPMGGFNECPENTTHMAIAKRWYEKYKAYPVCIGCDTIQFIVPEAVSEEEEIEKLAMEQYLYCGDVVWQGVQKVSNLQNTLRNSTVWYFWWD